MPRSTPDLYAMNLDGTGLQRLTNDAAVESCPRISPDGTQVAFVAKSRQDDTIYTVEMMRLDGMGRHTVGTEECIHGIFFSRDGRYLYFDWQGREFWDTYGLDRIDLRSGKVEVMAEGGISENRPVPNDVGVPGRRQAWVEHGNLWFGTPKTDDIRLLPLEPGDINEGNYGPGGRFVVCPVLVQRADGSDDLDIWLLAADGTLTRTLAPSVAQETGVDLWMP